jgi:RsiW-degrading membrane proteinase PrsW (M82 family)
MPIVFVILGLLPSFVWLIFYLREDFKHPEPKRLIFLTFAAGALVTVFVLQLQIWLNSWLSNLGVAPYSPLALLALSAVEEIFKFVPVYLLIAQRKEFDEPLDAMIYMIVSALGFAAVENTASIFQSVNNNLGATPIETATLRFVGATLLHSLASALVGYHWGLAMLKKSGYLAAILGGLAVATLLHAVFNYLVIQYNVLAFPVIFLLFIGFFVLNDFEKLKKYD